MFLNSGAAVLKFEQKFQENEFFLTDPSNEGSGLVKICLDKFRRTTLQDFFVQFRVFVHFNAAIKGESFNPKQERTSHGRTLE